MSSPTLATFLTEKIAERGLTLRRVSDLSGISMNHLEHLVSGDMRLLPAAPYLRGYMMKLGGVLGFDPEPWLKTIQASTANAAGPAGISGGTFITRSGPSDALPTNRYHRKRVSKKWAFALVGVAIVAYIALRFSAIFGLPTLTILVPDTDLITTSSQVVTLRGTLQNGSSLKINQDSIAVAADGSWQKDVTLSIGQNTYEFTAQKFLGRSRTEVRQILYVPSSTSTPATGQTPSGSSTPSVQGTSTDNGAKGSGSTTVVF